MKKKQPFHGCFFFAFRAERIGILIHVDFHFFSYFGEIGAFKFAYSCYNNFTMDYYRLKAVLQVCTEIVERPVSWEDTTMTRSNAREIAVQLVFSLSFGNDSADELLENQLTPERFEELSAEMPLYSQFPNEKQRQYIEELVRGVFAHGPELDDYINRYAAWMNLSETVIRSCITHLMQARVC